MQIFRVLVLVIAGALIAGCAVESQGAARLAMHNASPVPPDAATISGMKKKSGFLGTPRETFITAVDGALVPEDDAPVFLAPGIHSLVVASLVLDRYEAVPFRIEALAGARYVIRWDEGREPRWDHIYIEDMDSGQPVSNKVPVVRKNHTERHQQPPSSTSHATMRGSTTAGFLERDFVHLASVNGVFVQETSNTLFGPTYDYTAPVLIEPGLQALGIGYQVTDNYNNWVHPILLEVKPGASYVVKFEHTTRQLADSRWRSFTLWIEDERSGETVMSPVDIPLQRLLF